MKYVKIPLLKLNENTTIKDMLDDLSPYEPVIVGGYLRYLLGVETSFKDVDILLLNGDDYVDPKADSITENDYGGTRLIKNKISFDVWNIEETFFLKNEKPTLDNYLKNITKNSNFKMVYKYNSLELGKLE